MLLKSVGTTLLVLTLGGSLVSAQSQPAPRIAEHLEILSFKLGSSTLTDVQAKFGKSATRKCSREEEVPAELCYASAGKNHTRVVFEAGFSGGWEKLDGYRVIAGSLQRPCYRQCPRASQVTSDLRTKGGLKLGLTREQLIVLLGAPKETRGNELSFQWQSRQPMTKEQRKGESETFKSPVTDAYYDVQDTIKATLADSKVVEFAVHHFVTY